MKALLIFCFFCSYSIAQTKINKTDSANKFYLVSGKVTKVRSYCGGAEPSPEILEYYQKPQPYTNKIFYVREGSVNTTKRSVILSIRTDSAGKFSLKLKPGVYSIIQEAQVKALKIKDYQKKYRSDLDVDCLIKWWKKPYHVLEIKNKDVMLDFAFFHKCFVPQDIPCVQYSGPLPP